MEPWAVHFSIIFSLRFWDRFWTRFGSVLGSSWAPFDPLWEAKSGQVGPKMRLEVVFFRKGSFSQNTMFSNGLGAFWPLRSAQDRLETGPRRVQEG